jgi:hypothetical protein
MPKILTKETIEKIMSYPEDMTHAEIAKECKVSTTTVLNYRGPSPHSGWEKIIESKLGSKSQRKLTRDQVEYIRGTVGVLTPGQLARMYKVSDTCIRLVRKGQTYREML